MRNNSQKHVTTLVRIGAQAFAVTRDGSGTQLLIRPIHKPAAPAPLVAESVVVRLRGEA